MQTKPEIFGDIVRNSMSAGARIQDITFDTDTLVITIKLTMEHDSPRAKQYLYSNIYLGQFDTQSFMQHVRNIVAAIAKHHAILDTVDVTDFKREILY